MKKLIKQRFTISNINLSWLKSRFYRKSLLIILLITCFPTLLIGIGVNIIGTRQVEKSVIDAHHTEVMLSSQRIDDFLTHLEKMVTQWAFSSEFGMELKSLEKHYDYEYIRKILNLLLLIKSSSPMIEQAYLYMDSTETLYSEDGGMNKLDDLNMKRAFHRLLQSSQSAYWETAFALQSGEENINTNTVLVYQLPVGTAEPFAVLIIVLNREQIGKLTGSFSDEGGSMLVAADGKHVITPPWKNHTFPFESDFKELVLSKELPQPGDLPKSFIYDKGNEKFSVSCTTFTRLGQEWTYITTVSFTKLSAPVVLVSRLMYTVGLACLVAAVIISLVASHKLYQPIRYLMNLFHIDRKRGLAGEENDNEIELIARRWQQLQQKSLTLQERLQQHIPLMREAFLLQLLQGHLYSLHEADLRQRMKQFGWDANDAEFTVLAIQLSGMARVSGRFRKEDQQLITFAAANIAEENGKRFFRQAQAINFQNLTVGLFIIHSDSASSHVFKSELYQLSQQLINDLYSLLRMEVTVSIGKTAASASSIPNMFENAVQAINFRDLNGTNQILNGENYGYAGEMRFPYPFSLENSLLQAIRVADEVEAVHLLEKFCEYLIQANGKAIMFQQGVLQLLGNLQFGLLKAGYNPYAQHSSAALYDQLSQLKESRDVVDWFHVNLIKPFICDILNSSEGQQSEPFVEDVVQFLHDNYQSTDISLELCADNHGISPLILSRAFKKGTGMNFIDYLTQIRLNKSKELLTESDFKINEVAEQVGYQSTYFNRIFKKHEGMTPSRYRELSREGQQSE